MDPVRPSVGGQSPFRPVARATRIRHPRLAFIGAAATALVAGGRYRAYSLSKNEQAQKSREGNFYVSVDRSGGGV